MKKGKQGLCNATHVSQSARAVYIIYDVMHGVIVFLFKEFMTYFSVI